MLSCVEVIPSGSIDRQICCPFRDVWYCNRADKERLAKHIFIFLLQGAVIIAEIEYQRTHQGRTLERYCSSIAVYIRHEAIAFIEIFCDDSLCLLTITPRLGVRHITMYSHQRQIDTCLYPAHQTLYIGLVFVLIAWTEETTCVVCPPRKSRCLQSQTCHNLSAECLPIVADISTP